ncbi:tRNA (adenosine(37)-N6)-threonylcarbamoyltransferase complex transferase subunit TsaD [Rubrimonas cliftonensis]|uniref:tRNA N6-adenosine threonylcarbamoyltransferase n=1 Tax=Rubrimonas cliftonensis TaxID=89524 RepID=A0A1H4BFQ9_9RHOB|nr:tRNA (adenosine(37)-N6)-threonylcarbamoyltransferase complex transferase subunit TsaD [Rubrimonas cliftonensis]SEA46999.1 O-sialoglycoprotein endopeptidase [Rubrimonas cliftonensis]
MTRRLTVLGIESSCDDTAAAVVRAALRGEAAEGPGEILSSVVWGQSALHAPFGGVVPEIAARAHAERLDLCVEAALSDAQLTLDDIDAVAATAGPGLIGGVLSGVMTAKGVAFAAGLPFLGVNHLEGHALTPRLTDGLAWPYLLLLVSGGHCQLVSVDGLGEYRRLGGSIDDAPGEAFDKLARHIGLGFPGGPEVERTAASGDARRFALPRPLLDRPGCDMSFSGLKTAARRAADAVAEGRGGLTAQDRADLCAAFQAAVAETLAEKTARAMARFREDHPDAAPVIAVAGGVAANGAIRRSLEAAAAAQGFTMTAPPLKLCTDNAAMIAWAGAERFARGESSGWDLGARPRWPLDETAAPLVGAGRKGPKA